MGLPLPSLALAVEGDVIGPQPGHVESQQLLPDHVPLGRTEFGILIDDVLEMVHHGAVGDEAKALGQMGVAEFVGIGAKEQLGPGFSEKFHRHGVDLTALQAGDHALKGDPVPVDVEGKGMSGLVGNDLHVVGSAVEIGEDEGQSGAVDAGAVAAHGLAGLAADVHHLPGHHGVPEFPGLGTKLGVEFRTGGQDPVGVPHGTGVAAPEGQVLVGIAQGELIAHPLGLLHINALAQGDHMGLHGNPELLHILLGVAVALHPVVAQRGVAVVAQLAAHAVPEGHQLVIDGIQLLASLPVPLALGLPGRPANIVVGAELPGFHLGDGAHLPLKGDLGRGDELGVPADQLVLLLQILHQLRLEGPALQLSIQEGHLAILLLQSLAEGAAQQLVGPALLHRLYLRQLPVVKLHLGVVELVPGVDIPADLGHGPHGPHRPALQLIGSQKRRFSLGKIPGIRQPLRQRRKLRLQRLHVHALILDLRKGHLRFLRSRISPSSIPQNPKNGSHDSPTPAREKTFANFKNNA